MDRREEYYIGKLRKSYSVSKLLNGIEKPEDRKMKGEKEGIQIHIHDLVKDSGKSTVTVSQTQEVNVDIKLEIDLPELQKSVDDLKDLIGESNKELGEKLKEIGDNLDEVNAKSEKEKFNKPMNRLFRFLEKLGDEGSAYHTVIKGTQKGVEIAQKIGRTYNKFAQWLALPQVPETFL